MTVDAIKKKIYGFKTKYKNGFLKSEIKVLLKSFPKVSYTMFNNALGVVTCMVIHGETIIYHHDIESAIRCCVEKNDSRKGE